MGEVKLTKPLTPGQLAIMRGFQKHGADSGYVPSDPMDLRVCLAMKARGLLQRWEEGGTYGYELTAAGRAALPSGGGKAEGE